MGDRSAIAWTDATWNPITGCSHISLGCEHCYAERLALGRLKGKRGYPGLTWTAANAAQNVVLHPERLTVPLRWRKPRRIFVCSMSDLFHPDVPDWFIYAVWERMAKTPQHTYQVLTKRPDRMLAWFKKLADRGPVGIKSVLWSESEGFQFASEEETLAVINSGRGRMFHDWIKTWGEPPAGCALPTYDWQGGPRWWPTMLSNLWLGVSVEDQRRADERIPLLLQTPAAVRFVSCEPLLGPVNLTKWLAGFCPEHDFAGAHGIGFCNSVQCRSARRVTWVIAGCESGPKARPTDLAWVRSLRDQCQAAKVPFFLKQLMINGKLVHVPELDGQVWEQFPEVRP